MNNQRARERADERGIRRAMLQLARERGWKLPQPPQPPVVADPRSVRDIIGDL